MLDIFKKSKRGGDLKCIECGNINYYTIGMVQKMESVVCAKCLPPPIKIVTPKTKKNKKRKKNKKSKSKKRGRPKKKVKKKHKNKPIVNKIKTIKQTIKPVSVKKTKRKRFENEQEYKKYLRLRKKMLIEAEYSCKECARQADVLQIHHIDNNNRNNSKDNLIVLCRSCHAKKHPKLSNLIMSSNWGRIVR